MFLRLFILFFFICIFSISAQNKTELYIKKYSQIAIEEMHKFSIPSSITLAQGILESGNGESRLAVEGNNHFGIKCHNSWKGKTIIADDDKKDECFRKYNNVADSYRDHSLFLINNDRYSSLFELPKSNYQMWAKGLKKAGYATNPKYSSLLIDLIDRYNLNQFDDDIAIDKNLYFSHIYGVPYLLGIGMYYLDDMSLYSSLIKTSFIFTNFSFGYCYMVFEDLYYGVNSGLILFPGIENVLSPQFSTEILYKKKLFENKRSSFLLLSCGVQLYEDKRKYKFNDFEILNMNLNLMPYLNISYLLF